MTAKDNYSSLVTPKMEKTLQALIEKTNEINRNLEHARELIRTKAAPVLWRESESGASTGTPPRTR
jgi:hypothetical protein